MEIYDTLMRKVISNTLLYNYIISSLCQSVIKLLERSIWQADEFLPNAAHGRKL